MMQEKAPIDGFGIGVNLAASVDVPALDCAYKLQEYAGKPRRKLSEGKATWPGRKQVWRAYDARRPHARRHPVARKRQAARRSADRAGDARAASASRPSPTLAQIRERAARDLARLPRTAGAARSRASTIR